MKKIVLILAILLLFIPSTTAFSAGIREVSLYLYDDYDDCVVNVSWENTDKNAGVVLESDDGDMIVAGSGNSMSYPGGVIINVGKTERGRWKAHITGEGLGTIFISGGTASSPSENIIRGFTAEDSGSSVKFSWEVNSEAEKINLRIGYTADVSGNVDYVYSDRSADRRSSVSIEKSDLTTRLYNFFLEVNDTEVYTLFCGETMYVAADSTAEKLENVQAGCIDGTMYASWDERESGSYLVMLYDSETGDLIKSEQIRENFYSFTLEDNDQVDFAVAENERYSCGQFDLYKVIRSVPEGSVTFPEQSVTKDSAVTLHADCPDGVTVGVYLDGTLLINDAAAGDYSLSMSEGTHEIIAYVRDSNGCMKTFEKVMTVDRTPPEVSLNYTGDVSVSTSSIVIEGRTEPDSRVMINGEEQQLGNGSFSAKLELQSGINPITVTAYDEAGNKSVVTFTASSIESSDTSWIAALIICVPLAAVLAVWYVFLNQRSKEGRK